LSTLDTIQKLSRRQQQLWLTAGRQKLTAQQHEDLKSIKHQLSSLWQRLRCERAAASRERVFVEDILASEWMSDYKDRLSLHYSAGSDLRIESDLISSYTGYTPPLPRPRQRVQRRPVVVGQLPLPLAVAF
jgi:hypothetical protein